jgi:hypothetical protein
MVALVGKKFTNFYGQLGLPWVGIVFKLIVVRVVKKFPNSHGIGCIMPSYQQFATSVPA